jgi:catechol 2,3-dioxygenase-like lactoylglutathione lyase family enzyme
MKLDPIIAVKDVELSAKWYASVLGCRNLHGGHAFAILVTEDGDVLLCLHQWGTDEHPTMADPSITAGNGLLLYFRVKNMRDVLANVERLGYLIEEELHLNTNSNRKEFSLRDPDGYFLTITDDHQYEG